MKAFEVETLKKDIDTTLTIREETVVLDNSVVNILLAKHLTGEDLGLWPVIYVPFEGHLYKLLQLNTMAEEASRILESYGHLIESLSDTKGKVYSNHKATQFYSELLIVIINQTNNKDNREEDWILPVTLNVYNTLLNITKYSLSEESQERLNHLLIADLIESLVYSRPLTSRNYLESTLDQVSKWVDTEGLVTSEEVEILEDVMEDIESLAETFGLDRKSVLLNLI